VSVDSPALRPRLLFICQHNPWRLDNGGIIRNYWLLHALTERFDVDLVTADDADLPIPADFRSRFTGIRRFPRATGLEGRLRRARGALRLGSSYYTSGGVTPRMRSDVAQLGAERGYRAIVTELAMIDAVPPGNTPVVYASHNSEATLLMRRAKLEPMWSRLAMTVDALRVRRLEGSLVRRSRFVSLCSQNDIDDMAKFVPVIRDNGVIVPNGVDVRAYAPIAHAEGRPGVVLITGSFDWLPNKRGLLWFIKDVLPILERLSAKTPFSVRVAGRMTPDFARKLNEIPHVTAVANVPRMDVELQGASIVAAAVIASSGTRLRILEAWAAGRPVVTTPHGAFGLDFADGADLLSRATPQQFAEAIVELLADAALRERLREGGLRRAADYDWPAIGDGFIAGFERFGLLPPAVPHNAPAAPVS
jgi:glycosyltransferase involved in cell wall biosynthesis